ncbi:Ank2 [Symbiodinium natans]|uniref:Ank2 protein n=1 Tax=Symbiodinium natans TaxID=878477 RepID=A0A812JYI2_9DINO|nr:Ank2 [Symbiodinium natans]
MWATHGARRAPCCGKACQAPSGHVLCLCVSPVARTAPSRRRGQAVPGAAADIARLHRGHIAGSVRHGNASPFGRSWLLSPGAECASQGVSVVRLVQHPAAARENQRSSVISIPSYVDSCNIFLALVPPLRHSESGKLCDYESWLERGWCRAELWCAQLSNKADLPMVVVHAGDDAEVAMANHWIYAPVQEGVFTVDADRHGVNEFIQTALHARIAYLTKHKQQLQLCRYLKARLHDWVGQPDVQRPPAAFLSYFGFKDMAQAIRTSTMGGMACAAVSGDVSMVRALADAKASVNTCGRVCRSMLSVGVLDYPPMHLALQRGARGHAVVLELLRQRASPNSTSGEGNPCLGTCPDVASVEMLVRHGADVNLRVGRVWNTPIAYACAKLAPLEVTKKLVELKADVNLSVTPLSTLAMFSRFVPNLATSTADVLLQARADVNQPEHLMGFYRALEIAGRVRLCFGSRSNLSYVFGEGSTTPLGWAATSDNAALAELLLSAKADPDIPNRRGHTPRQLAARFRRVRSLFACAGPGASVQGVPAKGAMKLPQCPQLEDDEADDVISL